MMTKTEIRNEQNKLGEEIKRLQSELSTLDNFEERKHNIDKQLVILDKISSLDTLLKQISLAEHNQLIEMLIKKLRAC